jgi:hypothetical protein
MKRRLKYTVFVSAATLAALYAGDYLYAKVRSNPFADVKINRMYAMKNRWGQVEYSVGAGGSERCVYSLFPHFGFNPCWYVNRQTLRYVHVG